MLRSPHRHNGVPAPRGRATTLAQPGQAAAGFFVGATDHEAGRRHAGVRGLLGMHHPREVPLHREGHTCGARRLGHPGARARRAHVLPGGYARESQRTAGVLRRRGSQPGAGGAGRSRRGDAVQRLLLHLPRGAEPSRDPPARARRGQPAAGRRGSEVRRRPARVAPGRVAGGRHRRGPGREPHRQEPRRPARGGALRLPPAAPAAGGALGRSDGADEGGAPRGRHGRHRRRLPDEDAVLRRRAGPRRRALVGARVRAPQAAGPAGTRRRRPRGGVPELLPAVRPEPGGAAARRRGPARAGAVPRRADGAGRRPRAGRARPRHAPRGRAAVPRRLERQAGLPRAAGGVVRRVAAGQVRRLSRLRGRLPGVQGRPVVRAQPS